jgi:hypothetical protein
LIVMTELDGLAVEPPRKTAAHLLAFFDWAERKGEMPASTVQNWRSASIKILEIEDNWQDVNVVDFDLDAHLSRFQTLRRTQYTTASMAAYRSRAKTAIDAYRKWEAGASDWKPKTSGTLRQRARATTKATVTGMGTGSIEVTPKSERGGFIPHHTALIEYPFPLRPGVRAVLTLPEDLTETEAKRLVRFVESLAVPDQLAITTGEASAE